MWYLWRSAGCTFTCPVQAEATDESEEGDRRDPDRRGLETRRGVCGKKTWGTTRYVQIPPLL